MSRAIAKLWSRMANQKRMEKVSPARRREIAQLGGRARWAKARKAKRDA